MKSVKIVRCNVAGQISEIGRGADPAGVGNRHDPSGSTDIATGTG